MADDPSKSGANHRSIEVILPLSVDWKSLGTGGGVESFVKMFLNKASQWNMHVTVLSPGEREETIGSVRFVPVMPVASTERAFIRQLRHRLVEGQLGLPKHAVVLANAEHYAWAFRHTEFPTVLLSHGALPVTLRMRHSSLYVRLFRFFIERNAVRHSACVAVVNSTIKQYYLSRYKRQDPQKFVELPIGLDLEELEGRPRRDPLEGLIPVRSASLVLFVGRLYPEKNVALFIAACDDLRQRGELFQALVVGDGIQAGLVIEAAKTRPWLHRAPRMPRSDLLDAIALSKLLAITSRYESGPLTLLEAIGLGTPVASTDVGRARDLLTGHVGRILSDDPRAFADGMQDVLSWPVEAVKKDSWALKERIDFHDTMERLSFVLRVAGSRPRD